MTVLRVLRTAKATLSRTFYLDEVGTDATGSVAVTIARLDGTVLQTGDATGPDADHAYTFTFAGRDVLDELLVTWAATVGGDAVVLDSDRLQVVGGFYFGLAEGRAEDPKLSNVEKFPTSDLIEKRIETEDECERICDQAFVPRFRRAVLSGTGQPYLVLPDTMIRTIRSISSVVSMVPVSFTTDEIAGVAINPSGVISLSRGWHVGAGNFVVEYEHGHDYPPSDIRRASKLRFKSLLLEGQSALPDRAERVVTVDQSGGSVTYGTPTPDRTGIPTVDAAYGRYPSPRPGFG